MEKDIKIFGDIYLDTDSDPKVNKGSDYILNTIAQSDGRFGVAVNVKGNEKVIDFSVQFGSLSKVVGSCKDEARGRIIVFIQSNNPYGAILFFDISNSSSSYILHDSFVNFGDNVVANVIGDILYWTDNVYPPRKINYIKAYNLYHSISTDYEYKILSADLIEAYKKPPDFKIQTNVGSSIYATKIIPNKIYQFAYRYVYGDYEKSVLSPFSNVAFTDIQQFADGTGTIYSSAYAIYLYFKLFTKYGNTFTDIDSVELFVRNSDLGNWYLYDKIDTPKINNFILSYYSHGTFDEGSGEGTYNDRGTVSLDIYNKLTIGLHIVVNSVEYYIAEKFTAGGYNIIGLNTTIGGTGWVYTCNIIENFTYIFKDDKIKQDVDQEDLARPYDFLPKLAGTQELIEKDKLIYANITEGFDNVNVNVDTTVVESLVSYNLNVVNNTISTLSDGRKLVFSSYPTNITFLVTIKLIINTISNDLRYWNYIFYTAFYTSKTGDTDETILNALRTNFVARGIDSSLITVVHNTSPSYFYLKLKFGSQTGGFIPNYSFAGIFTTNLNSTYKTLKDNDSYLGAITYYDKNLRHSFEQKFNSDIIVNNHTNFNSIFSLSCSIKNIPPIWAYYYSIDFTKRIKVDTFIRLYFHVTSDTISFRTIYSTYAYFDQKDNYLRIQVNRLINDSVDINPNLKLNGYTFTDGDRIRLYGDNGTICNYDLMIKGVEWPKTDERYQKDYATTPSYILDNTGNKINNPSSQVIIVPVTRFDVPNIITANTKTTYLPTPDNETDLFVIAQDLTFEIYTPKKEASNSYYFPNYFGQIGAPGTSGCYHIGTDQNQNPSNPILTPAIVQCNPGDTYLKLRFAKFFYPTYDDNYSDYYVSNSYGNGMPNIFNPDAKEETLISGMRNSGSLLEDTKINKLNQFKSADLEILKSKFGTINSLKEVGNVLKVLQDKKETSIYISRTEMQNADNTSNVVKSTALLGTVNSSEEDRGTIFSKSIVVHNRNMYYFDLYRGEVVRSSANGQYPISEYGMRTYFKNKSKLIQSVGVANIKIVSAFDEENKMYLLTFNMGANSETIGFYDPEIEGVKPRWISFFSFIPDHYESFGVTLLSFKIAIGYKHNSNNVNRCTFYGVKYKQQINWYSNAASIIKKVFKVLGLKTNKAWDVPVILIEPDATYTRGMKSLLKTSHFALKEGEFSAAYLNNMKTTSNVDSVLDLFNGDELRGNSMKHQMENLENGEVWIMEGAVGFDASNNF